MARTHPEPRALTAEPASAASPVRVGLIGLGAIGRNLVRLVRQGAADEIEVVGALVREPGRGRPAGLPPVVGSVGELLAGRPDLVVEAGGHEALATHGRDVLRAGVDVLAVSVGALADPTVERALLAAAAEGDAHLRIAAGAIGALDALAAAAVGGLDSVCHTVRKPARTLLPDAEAADLVEARELFRGSARRAALLFPESVNVAAAVSLAGLGLDRTEVRVIADPAVRRNQHEVVGEGRFGWLRFEIRNVPTDENPRTGRLVAMSLLHCVRQRGARLQIG
jgi:aspartate dehydrogenase